MATIHEQLSHRFYTWEQRGRGWKLYGEPVYPEPPFAPFENHSLPETPVIDDGRRPTILSSLWRKVAAPPPIAPVIPEPDEEPEPIPLVRDTLVEFVASLPDKLDVSKDAFEQFLLNLSMCREPIAFELLGTHKKVTAQFASHPEDAPLLSRQLQAFFPEAIFVPGNRVLEKAWNESTGDEPLAVEFGLAREFMLPLTTESKVDSFVGIVGALSALQSGELALFQVLFQPVSEAWPESIVRSVTHADGKPFFLNKPELAKAAENKVAQPLFAAIVRIFVCTDHFDRSLQIARDLAGSLRVFAHPNGNELIPLENEEYHLADHIEDVLARQTRRTGMILNSDELTGFVHLPSSVVRSPAFVRQTGKTKPVPSIVRNATGLLLGENEHAGESEAVRLTAEQRTRHVHIIGASGTGKSTLLFNLIRQDIENGEGVAVLDPHGDLIDRICGIIPAERVDDVVLVNPSDPEYSVGFNILSAHSETEKDLLASDLVAVFQRLSSSWGDQMNSVLQNAILAFLESDRKGTLADLRRFLVEPAFKSDFLKSVRDSEVLYFWQKSFPHLTGGKSIGSILTRLDTLLSKKPIRYMVSQPENKLDFADIMDSGKILLAKLPEGLLGEENSYLLGSLLISKFQQIALSRQAQEISARRDFWLYIDEFANFITPSMAKILTTTRKYRLGLTLAHHELHQLERNKDVASAVMSHPYTRIVFRVSDDDAKKLAEGFSYFEAKDLRNLQIGQAVCKVERADFDFNLSVSLPSFVDEQAATVRRNEVITASRRKYAVPRADVEAFLAKSLVVPVRAEPAPKPSAEKPPPVLAPTPESSKVAEPPKETVSEKKISSPPPAAVEKPPANLAERESPPIPELGRGGNVHKSVQERIQKEAHVLGFHAEREKTINAANEAVDVLLSRGDLSIAAEITITTTVDHEFGNVKKCLAAGFSRVAMISPSHERLKLIAEAVKAGLGEKAVKVGYYTPDEFIAELRKIAIEIPLRAELDSPALPDERISRGYKIRRIVAKTTEAERQSKETITHKAMAEAMKRKR
jgi:hypothetical protein